MWFWLALLAAVMGAVEIIFNKHAISKVGPLLLAWVTFAFNIPILLILTLSSGIPSFSFNFWVGAIGSSFTFIFYRIFFLKSINEGSLSQLIPLTAFSGIFTYLIGLLLLSETISLVSLLGMISVLGGAYILNADQAKEDLLKPIKLLFNNKGSLLFLFAIVMGSITAVFDKIAVVNTKPFSPMFTLLVEHSVMTFVLLFLVLKLEKTWLVEIKKNALVLITLSLIFLLVGLVGFFAYKDGAVALVIGVKRLQIFFTLILAWILFKDKPTKHSWIAAVIMVFGVILIKVG